MKFEDWLLHDGLSTSSAQKYVGAIQGPLTDWSNQNELLSGPLIAITSLSRFQEIDEQLRLLPIFIERNSRGHHMYSSALVKFLQYLSYGFLNDVEGDIEVILSDPGLDLTERTALVKSRIGQGIFRQRVLAHWKQCSVTGFLDTSLLVASHIKPWSWSNNAERLDGFNGLLLTPNLDKAFDSGHVTFDEDGLIAISPFLKQLEMLGISANMRLVLAEEHQPFMAFHRTEVFREA